jgi:hypothetical protein
MANQKSNGLSVGWQITKIMTQMFAAIIIPSAIAYFTIVYSNSFKEREIGTRYVELAINILREEPSKQKNEELRTWAVSIVKKYSPVPISNEMAKNLVKKKLVTKGTPTITGGGIGDGILGDKMPGD